MVKIVEIKVVDKWKDRNVKERKWLKIKRKSERHCTMIYRGSVDLLAYCSAQEKIIGNSTNNIFLLGYAQKHYYNYLRDFNRPVPQTKWSFSQAKIMNQKLDFIGWFQKPNIGFTKKTSTTNQHKHQENHTIDKLVEHQYN